MGCGDVTEMSCATRQSAPAPKPDGRDTALEDYILDLASEGCERFYKRRCPQYPREVKDRLGKGGQEYGDSSLYAEPGENAREATEETADGAGWAIQELVARRADLPDDEFHTLCMEAVDAISLLEAAHYRLQHMRAKLAPPRPRETHD